jgi:hypothetical protein
MRHHYVPQFLLRAWADTMKDKKVETFRLDLQGLPSSRRSPKFVAYEEDLYALSQKSVAGMEQQAIEKHLLRHIDEHAARVRSKLICAGFSGLTYEDKCDWTRFLMSLRLREPQVVQKLRTEASEYLKASLNDNPEVYEAIAGDGYPPTLEDWVKQNYPDVIENVGMPIFAEIANNWEIGNKILCMK